MIKRIKIIRYLSVGAILLFVAAQFGALGLVVTQVKAMQAGMPPYSLLLFGSALVAGIFLFALLLSATSSNVFDNYFHDRTLSERISTIDQQSEELRTEENKEQKLSLTWATFRNQVFDVYVHENIHALNEQLLIWISKGFELTTGLVYLRQPGEETFQLSAKYAWYGHSEPEPFRLGETLPGQAAKDQRILNIQNVPENYIQVVSGLGKGTPRHLLIVPLVQESQTVGLIELASFHAFDAAFTDGLASVITLLAPEFYKQYTAK